jgi:hypothetical protein
VGGANGGAGNGNVQLGVAGGLTSGSPVKESSFLNRETSVDEVDVNEGESAGQDGTISPPSVEEGIPIRR